MSEWRKIDCAPRNERVILGWYHNGKWRYSIEEYTRDWKLGDYASGVTTHDRATHWMPLPEPPSDATP